jgi:predicted nucleic acid-binding protein
MAVLIDSSVWIAGSNPKNKECLTLKRLMRQNEAIYIARPIQVEVSQGAKTTEQFHELWEAFLGFEFLEITDRIWGISAWNYFSCRKKGLTISTMDCLIGTLAHEYRLPLWSLDKSFEKMRSIIGFELKQL